MPGGPRGFARSALDALGREHRNLARVLGCLDEEVRRVTAARRKPDLDLLFSILYYIRVFPEQYHHPKEESHLFARLRRRTHDLDAVLDELTAEHAAGDRALRELEAALRHVDEHWPEGLPTLASEAAAYVAAERAHMRREETEVLPRAEALLTPEDWRAVDEAFARNADPAFGENVRAGFEALVARIERGAKGAP